MITEGIVSESAGGDIPLSSTPRKTHPVNHQDEAVIQRKIDCGNASDTDASQFPHRGIRHVAQEHRAFR